MKISQQFEVDRDAATVWEFFRDVPAVASCLPGAELTGELDGGEYAGRVSVKLGPMTASFEGKAAVAMDDAARTGSVAGSGVDRRGGSRGTVDVSFRVEEAGGSTRVTVDADVSLAGAVAQFGRTGLIQEMSGRLLGEFVACLEARLSAPTAEAAASIRAGEVEGTGLVAASVWKLYGKWIVAIVVGVATAVLVRALLRRS